MARSYNLDELREMSGNDESFIQEMLVTFLENNKNYLNDLNKAFENEEWKKVKFFAHKIKPSILLFKIDSIKDEILKLNEYSGNLENLDLIPMLLKNINSVMNEVFIEISNEVIKN